MTIASTDTLVNELNSAGSLPAEFDRLLHAVPRGWFVPDRIWVDRKPIDRASQPDMWLQAVYSNSAIVTQFDDGRTRWPDVGEISTCSASMPSTLAGMLDHLDVKKEHSVLEIGTGTGFSAALLSEIVGPSGNVTTVEIDQQMAESARDRLAGFDRVVPWLVTLRLALLSLPPSIGSYPQHRSILATFPTSGCNRQSRGGIIVTPVRANLTSGPLVRFIVNEDGTATGRMVPEENKFVWLRDPVSCSWASVVPDGGGRFLVRQKGIRRLWDEAESAYRWWIGQGKPVGPDWVWTITPEHQTIQLGSETELC